MRGPIEAAKTHAGFFASAPPFRAIKCAVPLKHAVGFHQTRLVVVLPRYQMRGPIEAISRRFRKSLVKGVGH